METRVGGLALENAVYNASGPRTGRVEALKKIGESRAGAVVSKSATLLSQSGNPFPRYREDALGPGRAVGSINSEGLPNEGIDYYISQSVLDAVKATGKPYIVSLSGLKLADNLEMLTRVAEVRDTDPTRIAGVELNLACPNIPGKPTVAYDFEQMEDVLAQVARHPLFSKGRGGRGGSPSPCVLGVKLAPYFDAPHFDRAAELVLKHKDVVRYVVTTNTIGNALVVDAEHEMAAIAPKGGFGGLGGGYVKQTALANVKALYDRLEDSGVDIVGVGGVASGTDAFELILCGARAVQVGTTHWTEGAGCFDRISTELEALMKRKGYTSVEQFRGKLKPYSKPQGGAKAAKQGAGGGDTARTMQRLELAVKRMHALVMLLIVVLAFTAMQVPAVNNIIGLGGGR